VLTMSYASLVQLPGTLFEEHRLTEALFEAVEDGDTATVTSALDAGASVHAATGGCMAACRALHSADGSRQCIKSCCL
jgi:hypothetical protein